MVSIYNRNGTMKGNGTMKAHRQYDAEVWAHDLSLNRIRLLLQMSHGVKSTSSTLERAALLKEFKERTGVAYSKATKEQKRWRPD